MFGDTGPQWDFSDRLLRHFATVRDKSPLPLICVVCFVLN